ncbi:hypothetical protein BT96DRAFT_348718 [Gymnopus androsaceus JB14]|uniref:Uncharacterized protein n=1 Tax=Gymnopus androsaceus JB14 TaxID=1447944 RepID=A0A6A4I7C6_9AGAR|nr:hypothetical protein BT96DRAFT_348718 [Gymnopus androsaceus JB14]
MSSPSIVVTKGTSALYSFLWNILTASLPNPHPMLPLCIRTTFNGNQCSLKAFADQILTQCFIDITCYVLSYIILLFCPQCFFRSCVLYAYSSG